MKQKYSVFYRKALQDFAAEVDKRVKDFQEAVKHYVDNAEDGQMLSLGYVAGVTKGFESLENLTKQIRDKVDKKEFVGVTANFFKTTPLPPKTGTTPKKAVKKSK